MIQRTIALFILTALIFSCSGRKNSEVKIEKSSPIVSGDGISVVFPNPEISSFFETEKVVDKNIEAELSVTGKTAATILPSGAGASRNIILFDNPDLSSSYSQLIQLQTNINQIEKINIKQKELELERIKDLQAHGSATGQELLNAETELSMEKANLDNERAALMEHESALRANGFAPEVLRTAKSGTAYLICAIPESQLSNIQKDGKCKAVFTAYPDEVFTGKIDAVADVVDNTTRMLKVRVLLDNSSQKLKAGMFANASFVLKGDNMKSVSENALITIQGKHYVFVKKSTNEFERREVQVGQQIGDRIIVFSGVKSDDQGAVKGVMQLKGLSFGY